MGQSSYMTIRAGLEATGEVVDRKSRFIAQIAHVAGEREAEEFIATVRARHHDARHNVPAWILEDGRERCSDDGEPSHSSGLPTLEVLRGAGLANVCCVVTRYFGGTLLGTGGLVRAYTAATQAAIASAREHDQLAVMTLVTPVVVQIPYSAYDRVSRMAADAGAHVRDTLFEQDVQLTLAFRAGEEAAFVERLREMAAGEELARVGEPSFGPF